MLWVPQKGLLQGVNNGGGVGSTTAGTAVTTGAASNTKGSVAECIASLPFDVYWVVVGAHAYGAPAVASEGCLDIMIGAAGNEDVLIPDLLMGYCGAFAGAGKSAKWWNFPLYVPAGARLSARAAGARVSTAFRVLIYARGGGLPLFRVGSRVTTYGVTVPNGTSITPGASGAEGAWTQVVASTTSDHFALLPSFQPQADTTVNNRVLQVDLGIGAAAAEDEIGSWWFNTDGNEFMDGPNPSLATFQDIPSGTRLAARASNSGANDAGYGVAIHAVS
jgi:hypothetical protein